MERNDLAQKILGILARKAKEAAETDHNSIDYAVIVEEMADCTFLLENAISDEAIFKVTHSTTSGSLYDLLKDLAKPATEMEHSIIVTIEEHISGKFTVNACNVKTAMEMVEDGYNRGDMVVEPAPPTARLMMACDTVTGETTKWVEF